MKSKVNYHESVELKQLAIEICSRYSTHLYHVDPEKIYFCMKTSENGKPKSAKIAEVSGLKNPWVRKLLQDQGALQCYCLSAWADEWDALQDEQRQWVLFYLLFGLSELCDGTMRKRDVESEFGFMIEFLGPYWRLRGDLPNMLGDEALPLPPPFVALESESDSTL